MSHTLTDPSAGNITADYLKMWTLTIVNYTTGGEAVSASEVGLTATQFNGAFFSPSANNSQAKVLFPILTGGTIKLYFDNAGVFTEVPTLSALNAVFPVLVHANV